MHWKIMAMSWLSDMIAWAGNWLIYCPYLVIATSRNVDERERSQDRIVTKFLFSLMIQVVTGVISVSAGSYITLQIIGYRVTILEEASKDQANRQRALQDAQTALRQEATARMAAHEAELAVIRERNRIAELLEQHKRITK